jgi:hypothetical protein
LIAGYKLRSLTQQTVESYLDKPDKGFRWC